MVVKYSDEHVWVCVCVSVCPQEYLWNHMQSIPKFLCMLPMAMAWSSYSGVMKSQGKGTFLGFFFHIDNTLYSRAFGTHTKMAESIDTSLGWWVGFSWGTVIYGGDDPQRGGGSSGGKHVPNKPNTIIIANWTGPCSCTRQGQMLDCKCWTSPLSAAKWGPGLHTAGEVWYLRLPCYWMSPVITKFGGLDE